MNFCHFVKTEKNQKIKMQSLQNCKNGILATCRFSKIGLTYSLIDREMLKFPHCAVQEHIREIEDLLFTNAKFRSDSRSTEIELNQ